MGTQGSRPSDLWIEPETRKKRSLLAMWVIHVITQKINLNVMTENGTKFAPRFVVWVMLLWAATLRCYNMDVCFDAGGTENHLLHLNFLADLVILLIVM